jgi:hypothetical protein
VATIQSGFKWSCFVEFQSRFSLQMGRPGDIRVTIGMTKTRAVCEHCGLE